MKKIKTVVGYYAYIGTRAEVIAATKGLGICDWCAKPDKQVYVVPVLNSAMCENCFKQWEPRAELFTDDLEFEKDFMRVFERNLKKGNIVLEDLTC